MATQDTFKVSTKGNEGFKVTTDRKPQTLEEFETLKLVSKFPDDVIDLAWQNWVIKVQGGARQRLEQGEAVVQAYVNEYTYGARTGGAAPRPKLAAGTAKNLKFTAAQLEALRAAGMVIEQEEAAA